MKKVLKIRVEKLGESHPDTVSTQKSLEAAREKVRGMLVMSWTVFEACVVHIPSRRPTVYIIRFVPTRMYMKARPKKERAMTNTASSQTGGRTHR